MLRRKTDDSTNFNFADCNLSGELVRRTSAQFLYHIFDYFDRVPKSQGVTTIGLLKSVNVYIALDEWGTSHSSLTETIKYAADRLEQKYKSASLDSSSDFAAVLNETGLSGFDAVRLRDAIVCVNEIAQSTVLHKLKDGLEKHRAAEFQEEKEKETAEKYRRDALAAALKESIVNPENALDWYKYARLLYTGDAAAIKAAEDKDFSKDRLPTLEWAETAAKATAKIHNSL